MHQSDHRRCVTAALLAVALPLLLSSAFATARAQQTAAPAASGSPAAPADTTPVTVDGAVYDSLRAAPLAGATVQLIDQTHPAHAFSVTTDTVGDFRIPNVPPGTYVIGFLDPELDELGLSSIERPLVVGGAPTVHVVLDVPGAVAIRTTFCGAQARTDSTGMMLGFVRDADDGLPIGNAGVAVVWWEIVLDQHGLHRNRREVPAKASSAGWFAICGLPTDGTMEARAELGKRITSFVDVAIPPRGLVIRDFSLGNDTAVVAAHDSLGSPLGDPVRHGTAQLAGTVYDPSGKPLHGAHVTVWGAGATGLSDDAGRFLFQRLPSGTQTLEANYLGFAPQRMVIDLASGRTDTVAVRMTKPVQVLSSVHVYGKKSNLGHLDDFLRRRQQGLGHYLTAQDIAQRQPYQVTDLFYTMPGMRVVPTSGFEYGIVSTQAGDACYPSVYIDGAPVIDAAKSLNDFLQPADIRGIEVYDAATTPAEYRLGNCGVVLIWTK